MKDNRNAVAKKDIELMEECGYPGLTNFIKEEIDREYNSDFYRILNEVFPRMTIKQGKALWWILQNKDVINIKGKDIAGSFRWNGSVIALIVGKETNYLTFYCSAPDDKIGFTEGYANQLKKRLLSHPEIKKIKETK